VEISSGCCDGGGERKRRPNNARGGTTLLKVRENGGRGRVWVDMRFDLLCIIAAAIARKSFAARRRVYVCIPSHILRLRITYNKYHIIIIIIIIRALSVSTCWPHCAPCYMIIIIIYRNKLVPVRKHSGGLAAEYKKKPNRV
jgi:hypothetical protein